MLLWKGGAPLFQVVEFTLRFRRAVQLHFFHQPALYAFLLDRLGNPRRFPTGTALVTSEHGRVRYERGQPYRFGLVLKPGTRPRAADWAELVRARARTEHGVKAGAPFGNTFDVESVVDAVRGYRIGRNRPPRTVRRGDLADPIAQLAQQEEVTLRMVSPLLILRTPVAKKDHLFDDEVVDPTVVLQRVERAVGAWFEGVDVPPLPADLELVDNRLVRADVSYPRKRLLGSSGALLLRFPGGVGAWAEPLLLAGLAGIGKATAMGQGRYAVGGVDLPFAWPPPAGETLLERAARDPHLQAAWDALADAGRTPGVDGMEHDEFLDQLTTEYGSLREQLATGDVKPEALRGLLLKREDGKVRPLAVPTFRDRFLQRAVLHEIEPAVEQLLEDESHAYRRGLSRRSAQRGVQQAHDQGYRHVLDADIAAFFDEVDWDRLRIRLEAFFGTDPLVDLLLRWVRAPVEFGGQRIQRDRGLPQGTVVSPVLANLYLDAFDEALQRRDLGLVRYADDFVVMCRSAEDAEAARAIVAEELQQIGLKLSEAKTEVTSFDHGFEFLGSLFCRSVVMDVPASKRGKRVEAVLDAPDPAWDSQGASGWAADLDLEAEQPQKRPDRGFRRPLAPAVRARKPVYVVDRKARLRGRRRGLLVEREGHPPEYIAWEAISEIALLGGHRWTPSVAQHALRRRIPISFHARNGEVKGVLLPDKVRAPSIRARRQWSWMQEEQSRLGVARDLVEAKIHNTRMVVRRLDREDEALMEQLKQLAKAALRAESAERLLGLEGGAAHAYFSRWERWLGGRFPFDRRTGRGADDPVNVMLNFLYTQLFRLTYTAALSAGLDAYAGVLHEGRDRYAALAADLQEPFRFVVDRTVLDAVRRGRVKGRDFVYSEKGRYRLLLKDEAAALLLGAWEQRMVRKVTVGERRASYRSHLFRQAESLGEVVDGERSRIDVFRMKW